MSLAGRRIAITRPASSSAALASRLDAAGATVLVAPAIRRGPPSSWELLDAGLSRLAAGGYDGVLFTSPAAVAPFCERLGRIAGLDVLERLTVGAVGPGTAAALAARGIEGAIVPPREDGASLAEAVAAAFGSRLDGARFLQPRAEEGRAELSAGLRARGAAVDVAPAYRTIRAAAEELRPLAVELAAGRCDAVVFASPSAVGAVLDAAALGAAKAVAIGETTARALRSRGVGEVFVAATADDDGIFAAVEQALR
ncbi:MAG TPA: uroporphyrinogen-III synthase [Vulgatibacter sp.]|nr:uroporphyrinogen-III synthase [Vulgatibacter sp.]